MDRKSMEGDVVWNCAHTFKTLRKESGVDEEDEENVGSDGSNNHINTKSTDFGVMHLRLPRMKVVTL
jgi:hypothetical protein